MIIPEEAHIIVGPLANANDLFTAWKRMAIQTGLETGIYIVVDYEYYNYPVVKRIFFKALEREFENSTELKRALKLQAFW